MEKRKERMWKKRHIKTHLKNKEVKQMEKKWMAHLPMTDKFETKQLEKHLKAKAAEW